VPVAAQAGVPITIMNMGRTQYDRLATRLIHDDIAQALPALVDETIARYGDAANSAVGN
jgi:NAD-dependent deacetylase